MYFYLYDSYLANRKFEKKLSQIEAKITSLGISGKVVRLNILKNAAELAKDAINKGAKTVVVIGNDKIVNQVIGALADTNVPLGIIPVGPKNEIAQVLGIPCNEYAPDVLSGRLIKTVDLGKVNGHYFLSHIQISGNKVDVSCEDEQYEIIPSHKVHQINICNLLKPKIESLGICNPKDGLLELVTANQVSSWKSLFGKKKLQKDSLFYIKKIRIKAHNSGKNIPVVVDGFRVIKTPITVEAAPSKLRVIVGKERFF
jgi:diacylglycerol kinase family enzyme